MMDIELAKQKLHAFRDLYGNELNRSDLIKDATNIFHIDHILTDHMEHIENCANDAIASVERFKKEIGF